MHDSNYEIIWTKYYSDIYKLLFYNKKNDKYECIYQVRGVSEKVAFDMISFYLKEHFTRSYLDINSFQIVKVIKGLNLCL